MHAHSLPTSCDESAGYEPPGVDLAELGGDLDETLVTEAATATTSPAAAAGAAKTPVGPTDPEEEDDSKSDPSPPSGGEGTTSDASWERDLGENTETDMSEFELLKDGEGGEVELEEGWEDEVNAMLAAEGDE